MIKGLLVNHHIFTYKTGLAEGSEIFHCLCAKYKIIKP